MSGIELRMKVFFSSSRTDARPFKIREEVTNVGQTLEVSNIAGKELELWLCNLSDKIIVDVVRGRPIPQSHCRNSSTHRNSSSQTSR